MYFLSIYLPGGVCFMKHLLSLRICLFSTRSGSKSVKQTEASFFSNLVQVENNDFLPYVDVDAVIEITVSF